MQRDGLGERSITEFRHGDFVRGGVRGTGGDLGMQARVRVFGETLIIEASGTGSEFERRPLRPGLPTIDIIFVQEGGFAYLDRGAWIESRGPLMIAPSGLPNTVRFTSTWRFVVARFSREALLPYVPMLSDDVNIYSTLAIPERAMQGFLEQTVRSEDEVSPSDSSTVERIALEMAGTMLRNRLGDAWQPGTPQAVLRDRAFALIAARSGDVRLDPAAVARELGVSLRHLQTIFADASSSVSAEIRRERARVARSILQDPRSDALSVAEVAEQSGFGSNVSMRRALDALYGLSATELRMRRAPATETPPRVDA
ncbi:helix-turn-helix domain-containing protein [Agromyces atrinae]|uniref:helix-turn-helix transcriptional regulator n=1 Tax=Agromyces atrinae TaxID=592376 RepID=UPI001F59228B|nr:helix-turn-helix domain-containing protein [Agromyces atrinae]MCI2958401.1 helix-turn-helix domain-containing protein [Agromyces atrinae]